MTTQKPLDNFDDEIGSPIERARGDADTAKASMNVVYKVPVNVQIVLGATKMRVDQVLRLSRGSVIEIDKKVGDPVDVMINDRIVARGELVVVEDNRLGVTLTELVKDPATGE